ncbi:hypothetical protein Hanom_Chr01g00010481 [Helianthus anomalus]
MIAILERMFETLGQMLREGMNQHVNQGKKSKYNMEEEVEEEQVKEEFPDDLELSDVELETTTDDSVPVQQDVTPNWYSTPWYYDPEPTDDDF